ncbi:uncharacterized protein LOC118191153 [Stegodyphus dumicola]|uniref:uncharacterized protein LOC118191153 n=1 Tax=Stegodyphus dumicola TaxID=202533 RepID=UPI0015AD4F65|nr:uncharacterized protein LOC118191153 [Stegodyphus dumicola]
MIQDYHLQLLHAGTQVLLTNIRKNFWIIRGRKTIQRVISKCFRCKRHSAKAPDTVPCPRPEYRVRDAYAFEVTGVDIAGPLYLKENRKVWILLFTCGVYRAVHLELIESLSTNGFFIGFRRFIAQPRVVYSDNGTYFAGTRNLLRSVDCNQIIKRSSTMKVQWKLNLPTAAWWDGWWERLVHMIKKLLRRVLVKALF